MHGRGIFIIPNKLIQIATFQQGKVHGAFKMLYIDKTVNEGYMDEGKLIGSFKLNGELA